MTFDEALPELFDVIPRYGARPDAMEAREFFSVLAAKFDDLDSLRSHLERYAGEWFRCLRNPPEWIQNEDWQWFNGKPMTFVGSIDAPEGTFHDEARFYLFWSPETGVTECVIQVS